MAALDLTTAVDRVRLAIADYSDPEILDDTTIQYVLTKNSGNENASIRECATYILGVLSQDTRERLDRLEFYGNQRFSQYLTYLKQVLLNPQYFQVAGIYAGGVDREEFVNNLADPTIINKRIPTYDNMRDPFYGE